MIIDLLINILTVPASQAKAAIQYLETTHSIDLVNTGFFEVKRLDVIASTPNKEDKVTLHIASFPISAKDFQLYEESEKKKQVGEKFIEDTKAFGIEKVYRGFFAAGVKY